AIIGNHDEAVELCKKSAVVAYSNHCSFKPVERAFKSFRRFNVEVVGGFIEQQHIVTSKFKRQNF
ncbi:MAG: hypothetical protein RL576_1390, partial [Actinomycetota bacterium]